MSDRKIIYLDDAIDALDAGAESLRRVLDDVDIVGAEREKFKWELELIEACISDMKALPSAQPEHRWIPVTERLPEEDINVLVCNENGNIEMTSCSYSTEVKGFIIWHTSGWRFGKVIAWMPLPEPYKERRIKDA